MGISVSPVPSQSRWDSVVNYAQSENLEAAQRIIDRLRKAGWLERNKIPGEAYPGLYDAVFTLEK